MHCRREETTGHVQRDSNERLAPPPVTPAGQRVRKTAPFLLDGGGTGHPVGPHTGPGLQGQEAPQGLPGSPTAHQPPTYSSLLPDRLGFGIRVKVVSLPLGTRFLTPRSQNLAMALVPISGRIQDHS